MASIDDVCKLVSETKKWTPLKKIVGQVEDNKFSTKFYYEIFSNIYMQVSPFKGGDYQNTADSPYAVAALICPDKSSAERIIQFDIENDVGSTLDFNEFFLKVPNSYSEILSFVKQENASFINESASYRIAKDGAFLFKSIETEKYKFYFRNPVDSDFEKPFAFLYKFMD